MARVETVPMRPERMTETLTKLEKDGLTKDMEHLSFWDARKARIEHLPIDRLAKRLGVRDEEKKKLAENMVFWVVSPGGRRKADRVYHATEAAREATKELYYRVARMEERSP
jgi:hypothetical protein